MMDDRTQSGAADAPRSAEEAFLEYFARREDGGHAEIEEYCERYPDWADELRALDRDWRELAGGLERAAGPAVDPSVTPDELAAEARAQALVDEQLARLTERAGHERYRILEEIDRGGMGAVLRVFDDDLRRELAMKVIIHEDSKRPHVTPVRRVARFLEEAQIAGQLDHPGIVPVHDLGVDEHGAAYFTMKLVHGQTLGQAIRRAHDPGDADWSLTRVVRVVQQVCEAMAYAHERGVLHRDLKPANVMVGAYGEVYVMDWGLARLVDQAGTTSSGPGAKKADGRGKGGSRPSTVARGTPSSAFATSAGDVVGTPAFMSPEQANGRIHELGPRSDVYAIGAILYNALVGRPPYESEDRELNRVLLGRVREGPPVPLAAAAPDAPPELAAICERAMERAPERRYSDMRALADELRAFLEGRVVRAYESGAWAGLRKWVLRNRALAGALAAVLALAVAGALGIAVVEARGRAEADAERRIAERERDSVLRLSARRRLDELLDAAFAPHMWPPAPDKRELYADWLDEARELVAGLEGAPDGQPGHRAQLAALAERARDARLPLDAPPPADSVRAMPDRLDPSSPLPEELLELDLPRKRWYVHERASPRRVLFGQEARGLVVARDLVEKAGGAGEYALALADLALALAANGQRDEARASLEEGLAAAPPALRARLEWMAQEVETELAAPESRAAALDEETAASDGTLQVGADDATLWWHSQLTGLVAELERLADPELGAMAGVVPGHGWGVARRLAFADSIEERSVTGPRAASAWKRAIASIGDPAECPAYGGLEIAPQIGLLPLGRDAASGLWEFLHLQSCGAAEPLDRAASGIVLVLVPGGAFTMGSQAADPGAPNFDPYATGSEQPLHRIELDPFFLSKYEVTQGQWVRALGQNPAGYADGDQIAGWRVTARHPVESVSWEVCQAFVQQLGLALPTEAQWEYAARAGTTTAWSTGADERSLAGHANLADRTAHRLGMFPSPSVEWLDDGFAIHAEVDALAPNPFGLHHVHGNIAEWCQEQHTTYFAMPEPGTGLRRGPAATGRERVVRSGAFSGTAMHAGSGSRQGHPQGIPNRYVGLRPARALVRSED